MKDGETDWLIYHLIPGEPGTTAELLSEMSGLDRPVVEESLSRLERGMLIDRRDGIVRLLSINESLIRCQIRYDSSLPFTIENGIVKEKKRPGV